MSSASSEPPPSLAPLWFGLLGGHGAWTAQLLLSYFVVSLACRPGPLPLQWAGAGSFQVALLGLTLVTGALALAAALVAFKRWRQTGENGESDSRSASGIASFLALSGALLSSLFFLAILLGGLSLVYLAPCSF